MEAYEAIYSEEQWETDFSYDSLGLDSFDVAGTLDFEKVEKMGYTFVECPGEKFKRRNVKNVR